MLALNLDEAVEILGDAAEEFVALRAANVDEDHANGLRVCWPCL